ncbi:MAG: hypothetical protein K0S27_1112 [Gammaproteobacteria bacterium]|jgi:hypothetical protein|nr:hypothetical protein [Gammaproteobacteria bacterium]
MRYLLFIFIFLCIAGWGSFSFFSDESTIVGSPGWIVKESKLIDAQASNLDPTVLKISLTAYLKARAQGLDQKQLLTVIDYSKPSNERRLWVIDVKNTKVLFNTWVAHGKNSGGLKATRFSNNAHSLASSLGVFVTENSYLGGHGYSMRIQGLEPGINDHVYHREVVFHGAGYASGDLLKSGGMLGRSWGCMAVGKDIIQPLVDTIKDNTVVVAYYPDPYWLQHSAYLS